MMKRTLTTRILSMILALCTVFTMVPAVFATEAEETQFLEVIPEETQYLELPSREENPEEIVPQETVPVKIAPVELESELPFGLKGMPEGYVLSEEQLASKFQLAEFGDLDALRTAVPGKDYVANEVVAYAKDEAEARMIAEAYNGILESFDYNTAVIKLQSISVMDAVALSADMRYNLPVVSQNGIVTLDPVETRKESESALSAKVLSLLPQRRDWEYWVEDAMTNPDPFLTNPKGDNSPVYSQIYQWWHDTVDTYAAWGVTTGNRQIKVAVLDTGVYASHEDLTGRVSHINVGYGTGDGNGHGSNVAGIIAATMNNGKGGAGIAPGVSILSVKVLQDNGSGTDSYIIKGVRAAADNGAHIINMSLGGPAYSQTYQDAVNYAVRSGTTVIAAMGNDGTNLKCYPAAYSNVIAVAATDMTNNRTNFSNYGSWCDVAAPGYMLWSTGYRYRDDYIGMSGTSQATPVVSGLAALYMSAKGWVSPATMEKVLESSCVKGGSNLGKGIVNAANMFGKNGGSVYYEVTDAYDPSGSTVYDGSTVPCDTLLWLYSDPPLDDNGAVVYTINGKNPTIKNGEIVNGELFTGPISLEQYAGKSITVKAISVSGVGVAGSVKTLKLKVSTSASISSIAIEGPTKLVSGKSATYKATVNPAKANQGVKWSIVEKNGMSSAKISSSGKLTTSSKQEGYVIIRATSKANANKYKDFKVTTLKMKPVSSMSLSQKSATLTLGTGYSADTRLQLSITKMVDSSKNPISPSFSGVTWTSSKTSVATVDKNGLVKAVAPGTATITCKTLDGSGKSATCKVTVKQRVTSISVSGNVSVAPGSSATYKATVNPTNASSKSVTWSLSGAPSGSKISSSGKVTLPKSAQSYIGYSFRVIATAKDGSGKTGSMTVKIQPKCTGLYATYSGQDSRLVTLKSGYVSSAVLYTYEDTYYSGNDTDIKLGVTGKNLTPTVKWSSSKPDVATVDSNGNVKAVKAGTAKITATAQDGSGKKATVTINVRNPVSSMAVKSSLAAGKLGDQQQAFGQNATGQLAYGKSASHSVVFADTYGTVSNKAVTWSFTVEDSRYTYTNYCKNNKLVKISSSGKVTTSSKLANIGTDNLTLRVIATSKDNPSVTAYYEYNLQPAAKKVRSNYSSVRMPRMPGNGNGYVSTVTIYVDKSRYDDLTVYDLSASSSNPDVAGVYTLEPYQYSNTWVSYQMQIVSGMKKGSATITVKLNDGSGKSCKVKATVY